MSLIILMIYKKFQLRQSLTKKAANKYINRVEQKMVQQANKPESSYALNPTDEIFKGDLLEKAVEMEEHFEIDKNENAKKSVKNKVKKIKKKPVVVKKVKKAKSVKLKAKSVKSKASKKKKTK